MIDKQLFRRMPEESEEDYKIRVCGLRQDYRLTWQDLADIINQELGLSHTESKYRREYNLYLRGREDAQEERMTAPTEQPKLRPEEEYYHFVGEEMELRERMMSSTERTPYYRLMRQDARFERFYKYVGAEIKRLPVPNLLREIKAEEQGDHEFVMALADLHIGACFESVNNKYSMKIAQERFEKLLSRMADFVGKHDIQHLRILSLGDIVQGILRISDLKLNEAPVIDALVFAMRLIADFLNKLSQYCYIDFLQVLYSNHDQLRPLGTKASELGAEDMGKILFAYLQDVLADNPRVSIVGDKEHEYLEFKIFDFNCIAMHGHQVKDVKNLYKDLANRHHKFYDYIFLGHTHSTKELVNAEGEHHECKTCVTGSFVGSCQYADSLFVGSKASVKIYEFDEVEGQIVSYQIILN